MSGQSRLTERTIARALQRLTEPRAVLAPILRGGRSLYGVFFGGNRRRRPVMRITEAQVKRLIAEGAVAPAKTPHALSLTPAGAAWAKRERAKCSEAYLAQHAEIGDRAVMNGDGSQRKARGVQLFSALRCLMRLRKGDGSPWLEPEEIAAAKTLHADWEAGQIGLVSGSDWLSVPQDANTRGPDKGREGALAVGLDARARVAAALDALAPALRRVVVAICLENGRLEEVERREQWPARSARLAIKLALAQLAARARFGACG